MREDLRQVLHLLIGLVIAALIQFIDPAVAVPLLAVSRYLPWACSGGWWSLMR